MRGHLLQSGFREVSFCGYHALRLCQFFQPGCPLVHFAADAAQLFADCVRRRPYFLRRPPVHQFVHQFLLLVHQPGVSFAARHLGDLRVQPVQFRLPYLHLVPDLPYFLPVVYGRIFFRFQFSQFRPVVVYGHLVHVHVKPQIFELLQQRPLLLRVQRLFVQAQHPPVHVHVLLRDRVLDRLIVHGVVHPCADGIMELTDNTLPLYFPGFEEILNIVYDSIRVYVSVVFNAVHVVSVIVRKIDIEVFFSCESPRHVSDRSILFPCRFRAGNDIHARRFRHYTYISVAHKCHHRSPALVLAACVYSSDSSVVLASRSVMFSFFSREIQHFPVRQQVSGLTKICRVSEFVYSLLPSVFRFAQSGFLYFFLFLRDVPLFNIIIKFLICFFVSLLRGLQFVAEFSIAFLPFLILGHYFVHVSGLVRFCDSIHPCVHFRFHAAQLLPQFVCFIPRSLPCLAQFLLSLIDPFLFYTVPDISLIAKPFAQINRIPLIVIGVVLLAYGQLLDFVPVL